jgi:hypothetical protein
MDTDERIVDSNICRSYCQHCTADFSCGIDLSKIDQNRKFNGGVVISSSDKCGLAGKPLAGLRLFDGCPLFMEQLVAGGHVQEDIRTFPLSQLVGKHIVFHKEDQGPKGTTHWEGHVLSTHPHGFVVVRDGNKTLLTKEVLLRLWLLFKVCDNPDEAPRVVQFMDN